MKHYRFQALLQRDGVRENVYVGVDDAGLITAMTEARPDGDVEEVAGIALPGFHNAHSHAFQYAMAGLAEHLRVPGDDFWSWRETMYQLALSLSPDQVEDIAAMLYAEMLRHGYTSVAEFHYLHHDADGHPYADPAEMGSRLIAAAHRVGMRITLVPVYYNRGDFGTDPSPRQRRFISADLDAYHALLEASRAAAAQVPGASVGMGIHSLRAADPEDVVALFGARPDRTPMHIHIAEQQKEVDASIRVLGARPVAWLADHVALDRNCHLVHATHLDTAEVATLAASGAVAVLCPSTEGNLGDGFFDLHPYLEAGGTWAVGSDSHVGLSPLEELRWLDYGCRMRRQKRNVVCRDVGEDSGRLLLGGALRGGRLATGCFQDAWFAPGTPLDAVVVDARAPLMAHTAPERLISTLIYASDARHLLGTLRAGAWVARDGRHLMEDALRARFHQVTRAVRSQA